MEEAQQEKMQEGLKQTIIRLPCTNESCLIFKAKMDMSCCSRCRLVMYCSRECQVADWRAHKDECAVFTANIRRSAKPVLAETILQSRIVQDRMAIRRLYMCNSRRKLGVVMGEISQEDRIRYQYWELSDPAFSKLLEKCGGLIGLNKMRAERERGHFILGIAVEKRFVYYLGFD